MKWASKLFGGKCNNQDKILLKTISKPNKMGQKTSLLIQTLRFAWSICVLWKPLLSGPDKVAVTKEKTSQQNRTEVQGTSFLHHDSSVPSVWWWIILYFADIQKEHRWNERAKLNSSSLSPDIEIQVLPTSLYKFQ